VGQTRAALPASTPHRKAHGLASISKSPSAPLRLARPAISPVRRHRSSTLPSRNGMASPSAHSQPTGVGPLGSPPTSPSPRRHAPVVVTLGAIEEDGGMRPDIPQRSQYRPMARLLHPFQFSPAREPPVTDYTDVTGPRGEKFSDLRNNRHVAKRGGWTRVLILVLIGLLLVSGLAVGLGVGLTKSNQSERYVIANP
jgi:hypothetical protein